MVEHSWVFSAQMGAKIEELAKREHESVEMTGFLPFPASLLELSTFEFGFEAGGSIEQLGLNT